MGLAFDFVSIGFVAVFAVVVLGIIGVVIAAIVGVNRGRTRDAGGLGLADPMHPHNQAMRQHQQMHDQAHQQHIQQQLQQPPAP